MMMMMNDDQIFVSKTHSILQVLWTTRHIRAAVEYNTMIQP